MKLLLTTIILLAGTFSFAANKTFQAIDSSGNILFTIEAEHVYAFSDGLARIQQINLVNNQWVRGKGYINTKGKVVIPCTYDKIQDFVDGRAWVKKKDAESWTLIDKQGNVIPTKPYKKVGYIMEGYSDRIAVYENGLMGWIDRNGNEVISCQYLGSSTFDKEFGLACVTKSGTTETYGFIDKEGNVEIPFQYKQAGHSSFHNGYCRVSVNGKTVLIDEKGVVQFTPKYSSLQNYSKGLMAVATKPNRIGWGYCNLQNIMVVPGIYDHATTFNEDGFAIVEQSGNKGLMNTEGEFLLGLKYETIYADVSEDGYICGVHHTEEPASLTNTPKDYFDANLNPVDVGNATLMPANGSNRIPFMENGLRGYMNLQFEIVVPAKYKKATAFSDGIAFVRE
ncbi:MAG: WG repeat-containing protein [Fluviicola sp.]